MSLAIDLSDPASSPLRGKLFWGGLTAVAAVQLVAIALICSHQVRKAEARRLETQVQQMAVAECLQYIPGATYASCNGGGPIQVAPVPVRAAKGAMPVSFSKR